MSFTYDLTASGTALVTSKVRLEYGDTDSSTAQFTDEELQVWIDREAGDIFGAAAAACDALSREYARAYDFETDGQAFYRSQMSKQYAQLAADLRLRSGSAFTTVATTKVDGYSDDIPYDETTGTSRRGRARAGYYDPDLPY